MLSTALVLPFLLLVRLAVLFYGRWGGSGWSAVAAAAGATALVWMLYLWVLRVRFQRRFTLPRALLAATAATTVVYVGYLLMYLSSAHAKTPHVRAEFTQVHPVVRVALSTVLLVDRSALVTDAARTLQDYDRWGIPRRESSLHFDQDSGYVHAVDLRTMGRPEVWNGLVAFYFRAMGLQTLRHVGTADHLHVSLPVPTGPNRNPSRRDHSP